MQDFLAVALGRTVQLTYVSFRPVAVMGMQDRHLEGRFPVIQPVQLGVEPSQNHKPSEIMNYTSPTLLTRQDYSMDLPDLFCKWITTWRCHRFSIALLLSHLYAPFMYSTHRYNSVFQAIEGIHKRNYVVAELEPAQHHERVASIVRACVEQEVSPNHCEWAEKVLRARNDKPLAQRIHEVISGTGEFGQVILGAVEGRELARWR